MVNSPVSSTISSAEYGAPVTRGIDQGRYASKCALPLSPFGPALVEKDVCPNRLAAKIVKRPASKYRIQILFLFLESIPKSAY